MQTVRRLQDAGQQDCAGGGKQGVGIGQPRQAGQGEFCSPCARSAGGGATGNEATLSASESVGYGGSGGQGHESD